MRYELTHSWHGTPLRNRMRAEIAVNSDHLRFEIQFDHPTHCHPDSQLGRYQEALWKYDVGELFLLNPKTKEYLEINLNSKGAWWMMRFSAIREADDHFDSLLTKGEVKVAADGSSAKFTIPRTHLEHLLGCPLEDSTFNITSISNTSEDLGKVEYASLNSPTQEGIEPDFHRYDIIIGYL